MLTVDQLIDLEVRIQEEIDRLSEEMASSEAEREAIAPDNSIGRLSRLDSMQMQEMAKAAQRRREERLISLEAARERMDAGEYGSCERCGEDIPWPRLEAQPEATRCGRCAG
jgi:DnaK suppressor protein